MMLPFRLLLLSATALSLAACSGGNNPMVPQLRPVEGGWVSSGYGPRPDHPVNGAAGGGHHDGYDFAVAEGSPVRASMAGTVSFVGWRGGYGKTVVLTHADGYSTLYGHASELLVREGQAVAQGEAIARVGSTGLSTGPHLHYELRRHGVSVDPGFMEETAPVRRVASVARSTPQRVIKKPAAQAAGQGVKLPRRPVPGYDVLVPDALPGRVGQPG